jgi:hypothetical protein
LYHNLKLYKSQYGGNSERQKGSSNELRGASTPWLFARRKEGKYRALT